MTRLEHSVRSFGRLFAVYLLASLPLWTPGAGSAQELPRQIRIKANIWEIQESSNFDYGVVWRLIDYDPEFNDLLESAILLPGIDTASPNPIGAFITATRRSIYEGVVVEELQIELQTAQREGNVQLRADPVITTIAGQEGEIHSGEQVPVVEWRAPNARSPGTLVTVYKDTGILLKVVPAVFRNEFVVMRIQPQISDIIGFTEEDTEGGLFVLPIYSTRSVTSTVMVRSGGTIILSGFLGEQRTKSRREVPYIAEIPVLGWLFRKENREWSQSDILIELTPTILRPGDSGYEPQLIYESDVLQSDTDAYNRVRDAEGSPVEIPEATPAGPNLEWLELEPTEAGTTESSSEEPSLPPSE